MMKPPLFQLLFALFALALVPAGRAAPDTSVAATITFTNAGGTTNGHSFTLALNSTNAVTYRWTNLAVGTGLYLAATNTPERSATNFYTKLRRDYTNRLTVGWVSATAVKLQSYLGHALLAGPASNGWAAITHVTNTVAPGDENTVLRVSNLFAHTITGPATNLFTGGGGITAQQATNIANAAAQALVGISNWATWYVDLNGHVTNSGGFGRPIPFIPSSIPNSPVYRTNPPSHGALIILGNGTFIHTQNIFFNYTNVALVGQGMEATKIFRPSDQFYFLDGWSARDLTIETTNNWLPVTTYAPSPGTNRIRLENVRVRGYIDGASWFHNQYGVVTHVTAINSEFESGWDTYMAGKTTNAWSFLSGCRFLSDAEIEATHYQANACYIIGNSVLLNNTYIAKNATNRNVCLELDSGTHFLSGGYFEVTNRMGTGVMHKVLIKNNAQLFVTVGTLSPGDITNASPGTATVTWLGNSNTWLGTFTGDGAGLTNAPLKLADGSDFIPSKTIAVFFGDSLTDTNGYTYPIWPVRVITRPHWLGLKGHINAAISGNTFIGATNKWATNALPQLTSLVAPGDTVLLSWGPFVNDQILYPPAGATNNPIAFIGQMSNFIAQMRADVSALGGRPFVSGNTTGVRPENESPSADSSVPANRSRWFINNFIKQSTNLFDVVCDFEKLVHPGNSNVISADRVHPSVAGNEVMAELFDRSLRLGGNRQIDHVEVSGTNLLFRLPNGLSPLKIRADGSILSQVHLIASGGTGSGQLQIYSLSEPFLLLNNDGGSSDYRIVAGDDNRMRFEDHADGTDLLVMNRNLVIFGQANNLKSITNHATILVVSGGPLQANSNSIFRGPIDVRDGHNLTSAGSLIPTNGVFLPTNTLAAASATGGWLRNSANDLYWITSAETNLLNRPAILYTNFSPLVISNWNGTGYTTNATFHSFTIPGNSLRQGDEIEIQERWFSVALDNQNTLKLTIGAHEHEWLNQPTVSMDCIVTHTLMVVEAGANGRLTLSKNFAGDFDNGTTAIGISDLLVDTTASLTISSSGSVSETTEPDPETSQTHIRRVWVKAVKK